MWSLSLVFFFFKQMTAYDMRISDWSSDVCSSDLQLEARHPGERSIVPPDAADAFVCHLIEDFADEWVTKMMFHYRWTDDATADWASHWIVRDAMPKLHGAAHDRAAKFFHDRQPSRLAMVGCTPDNAPLLEAGDRTSVGAGKSVS